MTSKLCQDRYIVNQVLESLLTAISEHRWKDALAILPSAVAFARYRISPYFIWKVLHIVMASSHMPLGVHMNILNIILNSTVKNHDVVLDMLAYKFGNIKDDELETLYESVRESGKQKVGQKYRILCKAYYALHFYLKWKKMLHMSLNKTFVVDNKQMKGDQQKEIELLGHKAYSLLNQAYTFTQLLTKEKINNGEDADRENPKMMCEWLLGPLLDIENHLNIKEKTGHKNRSFISRLHGIDLIEDYAKYHTNHLPALRTYYFYMTTYHHEEKTLIQDILQRIVDLSPENSLVLQYVYNILSEQFSDKSDSRVSGNCSLANVDIGVAMKCLRLLANFLEYQMWRNDVRAWKSLADILKIFHQNWVRCWDCNNCNLSINKVAEFSDTLNAWPELFWHEHWLCSHSKDDADVLIYSGYSSFILGFNDQIAKDCVLCLERLGCKKEGMKLLSMMKQKGNFTRDLLVYLGKQRKMRFGSQKKSVNLSLVYVITKTNIKFENGKVCENVESSNMEDETDNDDIVTLDTISNVAESNSNLEEANTRAGDGSNEIFKGGKVKKCAENGVDSTLFNSPTNKKREKVKNISDSLSSQEIVLRKKKKFIDISTSSFKEETDDEKKPDEVPNPDLDTSGEINCEEKNISSNKKKAVSSKLKSNTFIKEYNDLTDINLNDSEYNQTIVTLSSESLNSPKNSSSSNKSILIEESRTIKFGKRNFKKSVASPPPNSFEDSKVTKNSNDLATIAAKKNKNELVRFGTKKKNNNMESSTFLSPNKEKEKSSKPQKDLNISKYNPHQITKSPEKVRFGKRKAIESAESPTSKRMKFGNHAEESTHSAHKLNTSDVVNGKKFSNKSNYNTTSRSLENDNMFPQHLTKSSDKNNSQISFGRKKSTANNSLNATINISEIKESNTSSNKDIHFGSKGKANKHKTSPTKAVKKGTYNKPVEFYDWS